ncbi:MAG TPA: condensation domain-containing protein [Pirellulales bacterium]|jgi:thioesterase domain-containing protein/acyl carrier protein|nr:condensation domain-containing protein [Pirellulales bacterium]
MLKNVADIYPLTGMQQMMLVRTLSDRQASLFVEQLTATLEGRLDIDKMREAWQRAAARHPGLRTAIVFQGLERPLQVVREKVDVPLEVHDWRNASADDQTQRFADWSAATRGEPIDLARAPLVRLDLFLLSDDRYRFSCRAHHLLFDGWSLAILMAQVLETYGSLLAGRSDVGRSAPGFRDYVAWLDKQDAAAAEAFWQARLAGFRSPTPIGSQRAQETADSKTVYGSHARHVPADAASALTGWLRQRQLTLSTAIHAAWALLLARHSGQRDVVFGTTVSGRPAELPGIDTMIGPFINNVPLRVELPGEETVPAWLKRVQSAMGDLTSYQHTPLTDVERWSDLERQARLFESLVVLENYPRATAVLESRLGLRVVDLDMTATMVYPLSLVVFPDRFSLDLRYDRRRFTDDEAEALLGELVGLLTDLPKSAEDTLGELLATQPDALWQQTSQSAAAAGKHAAPSSPFVAPRDAIERTLAAVWGDLTGREKVGVRDNFFELGGDSLLAVRLMAEVERQFGRKLPLVWLFQDPTIERLAEVLRAGDQPAVCLVPIRPRRAGSRPPLFCAHPAGGTVFCYRELARLLPDDQPVYGFQARGIDGREPPRARLEEMAADYVIEMRKAQPVGPYQLLGWSLGGLIVFEMARQFLAAGQQTELVAIVDAGMIRPGQAFTEDDFVPMLLQLFPDELRPTEEELKNLKPDEQLDFFRVRAERARLLAMNDSPIEDQHVFQVFQANMTALLEFRPEPFAGRLTLFRARQDATPMHREQYMGWGPWALGGVEERRIDGEHVNLFREPYISQLATELRQVLG